jgi:hypothetical protein
MGSALFVAAVSGGTGLCPVREEVPITRRHLPHRQIGGSIDFMTLGTEDLGLALRAGAGTVWLGRV